MSELKAYIAPTPEGCGLAEYYLKSEADKEIADLEESHKMEVEQLLIEIAELKSENRFTKEQLDQQEKSFKWHKVEMLFGKLTGDLPSRDLNRICGRDFLVHYTVKYGNCISDGIAYSDYDEDEGFFELEDNQTPVHWCEVPLPPLADKFKEAK